MSATESVSSQDRGFVVSLHSPEAAQAHRVGVKAATLARLLEAGFPVPGGIVLTTDAFTAQVGDVDDGNRHAVREITDRPLSDAVSEALSRALHDFGDVPLAVRSSGVSEDLTDASFAGQYETTLGVRGYDSVVGAVRTCWASGLSAHVRSYRNARGLAHDKIAVLIQPLIQADAAGVAFTANPVTGDRTEAVVSAVRGLGDQLVSGKTTPDEWLVRGSTAVARRICEQAVTERQILAIAELARRVEAHLGAPQDIEWALSGGKLYLLQARPITALGAAGPSHSGPAALEVPPGFWQRGDSHYPQPLYPFTRSVLLAAANDGFRLMCSEFGLLFETLEEREIGGWVYLRAVPLGDGKDRQPPPDWLMRILIRILPQLRRRIAACSDAVRTDKAGKWVDAWYTDLRTSLEQRLTRLRDVNLRELPDDALSQHAIAIRGVVGESQRIHMMLNTALNVLLAEFAFYCRDLIGWEEDRAFGMLAGLSGTSSAPGLALARLAQRVQESPALRALAEQLDSGTIARMAAADGDFGRRIAEYEREYGQRTIRYELADPTLAEMPALTGSLIDAQIRRGYSQGAETDASAGTRRHLVEQARRDLAGRSGAERERFERALARAERAYPLREEHGFYDTSMPLALMRYAALEIGRRLCERKQVDAVSDIFFLEFDEATSALEDGAARHELVERRRSERAWALSHPGPKSYGAAPAKAPSFVPLPPPARFLHEAVSWFSQRVFAPGAGENAPTNTGLITGIGASAGRYNGVVRVIRDESQFGKVQPGDVLVCPITSPVWSVLFPSVGALVTDVGGILSHSAIIAREYRIPAVVATGNATKALTDGQLVTVDGFSGTVSTTQQQGTVRE